MHPAIPIFMVFVGCCSNVVFLEYLIKEFPGSGNIITFSQFLFIALEGFIFTTKFGRKKPVIPLTCLREMTGMYLVTIVFQCLMLHYNIPIPVQMTLRSGSLIANLVLGVLILKRQYKMSKYLSVIMITVGICICTIVSAKNVEKKGQTEDEASFQFFRWMIGVGMLTFALFMSARMGIYQEQVYAKHGKHPSEALFYNHALPLPVFIFFASDIYQMAKEFNTTELIAMPGLTGVGIPFMWLMLLGNVITQYICIRSVFVLTTECTSLTVTLVVTLRKFVSLLFSIWYFQNPFTVYHWAGTVLVFGGTLIFTETIQRVWEAINPPKQKAQ